MYPCVFVAFLFFDFFENAAWQPQGKCETEGRMRLSMGCRGISFPMKNSEFAIMTDRDLQIP